MHGYARLCMHASHGIACVLSRGHTLILCGYGSGVRHGDIHVVRKYRVWLWDAWFEFLYFMPISVCRRAVNELSMTCGRFGGESFVSCGQCVCDIPASCMCVVCDMHVNCMCMSCEMHAISKFGACSEPLKAAGPRHGSTYVHIRGSTDLCR